MNTSLSPALALLKHIEAKMSRRVRQSDTLRDMAMGDAVSLAIAADLEWHVTDLDRPEGLEEWRHYTADHALRETYYSFAVKKGAGSFCRAYEHHRERPPFILHGKRIAVGRYGESINNGYHYDSFPWDGKEVKCTSFAPDGSYLVAVSIRDSHCQYKITREDLKTIERGERLQVKNDKSNVPLRSLVGWLDRALNGGKSTWRKEERWRIEYEKRRYTRDDAGIEIRPPGDAWTYLRLEQEWGDPEITARVVIQHETEEVRKALLTIAAILGEHAPNTSYKAMAELEHHAEQRLAA